MVSKYISTQVLISQHEFVTSNEQHQEKQKTATQRKLVYCQFLKSQSPLINPDAHADFGVKNCSRKKRTWSEPGKKNKDLSSLGPVWPEEME